jgi:deoxycitidine kinase/deoxyguanosine kinase
MPFSSSLYAAIHGLSSKFLYKTSSEKEMPGLNLTPAADVRISIESSDVPTEPKRVQKITLTPRRVAPLIISIDGNIGSGKSTLVRQLKDVFKCMPNVHFIQEPVDTVWNLITDKNGETLLSNFYKDPSNHAFTFQMMAYISRLAILREAVKNPNYDVIITERCLETDRNVFEKMLHAQGIITDMEHTVYNMWFTEFYKEVRCNAIIYVRATVATCMDRIQKRAREGESVTRQYIAECDKYHEDWILKDSRERLLIEADSDSIMNEENRDNKLLQIVTFIHKICESTV